MYEPPVLLPDATERKPYRTYCDNVGYRCSRVGDMVPRSNTAILKLINDKLRVDVSEVQTFPLNIG